MDNFFTTYGNLLNLHILLKNTRVNKANTASCPISYSKCSAGEAVHELNLQDKPQCIFNVDETGHNDRECQNTEKVIGIRGKTTKQNQVC